MDLWAMDEVHFQQHGSRCRMWVPPEVRDPVLCHAWTHRSVGYWGAVRLHDGKLIYRREEGMFNKETCTEFLHQFHRESTRGPRRVVVIERQRRLPPLPTPQGLASGRGREVRAFLSPRRESPAQPDREGLEAHTTRLPAQSLLPQARRCDDRGRGHLRELEAGERDPPTAMRNYLGRCV